MISPCASVYYVVRIYETRWMRWCGKRSAVGIPSRLIRYLVDAKKKRKSIDYKEEEEEEEKLHLCNVTSQKTSVLSAPPFLPTDGWWLCLLRQKPPKTKGSIENQSPPLFFATRPNFFFSLAMILSFHDGPHFQYRMYVPKYAPIHTCNSLHTV